MPAGDARRGILARGDPRTDAPTRRNGMDSRMKQIGARPPAPAITYLNRELGQLEFNFRVLAQALDERVPLLERLRYLCISCTNLDEFFEVRVAILRQRHALGEPTTGPDQLTPAETLARIRPRALELVDRQYACWNEVLRPALAAAGIHFLPAAAWTPAQRQWLLGHFREEILPVLSPLGLDPAHPFPLLLNKSLNIAVRLEGRDAFGHEGNMALVRAPRSLPRIIRLPDDDDMAGEAFVFLGSVLQAFAAELFPGMRVVGAWQFRITRDGELALDEDDVENLARALREGLRERGHASAVRLEVEATCPREVTHFLAGNFDLGDDEVYHCAGPVNLNRAAAICDELARPELRFPPFAAAVLPAALEGRDLFTEIGARDLLLHHPFQSFAPVIELLRQASLDPDVLAIKQTLYRAGNDSPLVDHLIEAARRGKDVTVVVELRARFDEEANLDLATRMQQAGVQVVYGVVGYKTHAKMLLIVRREAGRLRRYTHLATGNYHEANARLYTDFGLMTADADIGHDVHQLFLQLSGLAPAVELRCLLHSPFTLRAGLMERIEREIDHALAGRPARILAKLNALNEGGVVAALYRASQAGVDIDLLVRGACALRPGVPGLSERIRVRSLVGRFLEHSRVYWFANGGAAETFCASADWMERNLLRRIEVCFPLRDPALAARVHEEALANYLADDCEAWSLHADGTYTRVARGDGMPHCAQQALLAKLAQ